MAVSKDDLPAVRETVRLLDWLENRARGNAGLMPAFSNAQAVTALHGDALTTYARAHGNVQARLDFACYQCGLPPLGLSADQAFSRAWSPAETWAFPVDQMQAAAQTRRWSTEDFAHIRTALSALTSGSASKLWHDEFSTNELAVKQWADTFLTVTAMPRTPAPSPGFKRIDWAREELILALDLYLQDRQRGWDDKDTQVVELSLFLRELAPLIHTSRSSAFRNANAVAMKLMNFRALDPVHIAAGKKGLSQGSKADQGVWDEFASNSSQLGAAAAAIRSGTTVSQQFDSLPDPDLEGITQAPEGRVFTRIHLARERSPQLVQECKRRALRQHGRLCCAACGLDFGQRYGKDLVGVIDCHHTNPVHTLAPGHETRVEDLVLLCPNCHRAVHAAKPWLTVEQLRDRLRVSDS